MNNIDHMKKLMELFDRKSDKIVDTGENSFELNGDSYQLMFARMNGGPFDFISGMMVNADPSLKKYVTQDTMFFGFAMDFSDGRSERNNSVEVFGEIFRRLEAKIKQKSIKYLVFGGTNTDPARTKLYGSFITRFSRKNHISIVTQFDADFMGDSKHCWIVDCQPK